MTATADADVDPQCYRQVYAIIAEAATIKVFWAERAWRIRAVA